MTVIPFAAYRPDVANLNSEYSSDVQNALMAAGFFIPMPSLAAFSGAVPAQPLGGIAVRVSGTVHIFVGTAGKIYKYNAGTNSWDHVSKLGATIISNGTFASDTVWSKSTGTTITVGVGRLTAVATATAALSQSISPVTGTIYKVQYTISGYSAGGVLARFTGGTTVSGTNRTANGTYTEYLTAVTGNNSFSFFTSGTTTLDIDNVTVQPLTAYGATVDERWRFRQYGNYVVAVNINDATQVYQIGVSTEFADLGGSPPHAQNLAVWNDRLALFNDKTAYWCDTDDISNWSTGTAGSQTFPDGGKIMAATDTTNPVIVQQSAIRIGTFIPGSLTAFSFTKIHDQRGAISPYAFGSRGNLAFFSDAGSFWQIDGSGQLTPIGFEKVDRTIFGLVAGAKADTVYCEIDPFFQRAYFAVKVNSVTDAYDKILIYDWQIGEWIKADLSLGILFPLASGTTSLSLDDDAVGDVDLDNDQGDVSLDSALYEGGAPLMAVFTEDFEMAFFNGANLEAMLTTAELGDTFGTRAISTGAFPVVDTSGMTLEVGGRNSRGGAVTYSAPVSQNTDTDRFDFFNSDRFQRFRLTIPSEAMWNSAQGIDVQTQPAGDW